MANEPKNKYWDPATLTSFLSSIDKSTYRKTALYGEFGESVFKFYAYHSRWEWEETYGLFQSIIEYNRVLKKWGELERWRRRINKMLNLRRAEATQWLTEVVFKPYHDLILDNLIKPPSSKNPDLRYWTPKRGLPDYFCWTHLPPRGEEDYTYFFVEVKAQKSPFSKEQKEIFKILKNIFPVYVFRVILPEDFNFQLQIDPF
jgi:hypothetical protein